MLNVFYECYSLASVTIPNSVTSIGDRAFSNCYSLASVTIGSGVSSIGSDAFLSCSCLTSITIPNSVITIGESAFQNCRNMASVAIGGNVSSIGDKTFLGCSGLTSITIPNSVTSIGQSAFENCSGLNSVTIPNSVTSIGNNAFSGCSGLTSVTIGNSIISIGDNAFGDCTKLMEVKSLIESPNHLNTNTFTENTYRLGKLYVPEGTINLYSRFDGWRNFLKIVEMTDDSDSIYLTLKDAAAGSMKLLAKKGEKYTIAIEPETGWKLSSVTFNDEDVTSQLDEQNRFTTPAITADAVLRVIYEELNTQVESIDIQDISIKAVRGGIKIDNAREDSVCQVFTTEGKLLKTVTIRENSAFVSLPESQVYIVKVGGKTLKVVC